MITTWLNTSPVMERQVSGAFGNVHVFGKNRNGKFQKAFSTYIDREISAVRVFDNITDLERLEERFLRFGASAKRIDPAEEPGIGLGWNIDFGRRERTDPVRLVVNQFDRPGRISMSCLSKAFEFSIDLTIISLDRLQSRVIFDLAIRPRDFRAGVMLRLSKLCGGGVVPDLDGTAMRFLNDLVND